MKAIHRRYPDVNWEFRALYEIIEIDNRKIQVVYSKSRKLDEPDNFTTTVEVYSGPNYILGERGRSHSRSYPMHGIPNRHKETVEKLASVHENMVWDNSNERLDIN